VRLFVAVDLSGEMRDAMAAEQKRIAQALGSAATSLKWVRPEQAHLTLVFLGEVESRRVPGLVEAIGEDVDAPPFDLVFSGVGAFPPRGSPRVLWTGIGAGARELTALQRELAARSAAQGIVLESREFHPHLTLARWPASRPADRDRLTAAAGRVIGREQVSAATLYESRLSSSGAVHTPLTRANLTGT
jgi:2'-5' RNA ligase